MSALVVPDKIARPENLLFRSRLEICRIFQLLAQEQSPLSAEIGNGGHSFASRILSVDSATGHFAIAYCAQKAINAMLLDSPTLELTATDRQGLHFTFEASAPEEIQVEGQPAIQFALPKALLLHNQREHPRLPVPADLALRCIADAAGVIPFESHITDISHDGLGCLVYDPDIKLDTGTVLHGSRIILPNGGAVLADLEVRHIATTTLPDGTTAHRAGLRFVQRPDEIAKLVNLFIQNLDKK